MRMKTELRTLPRTLYIHIIILAMMMCSCAELLSGLAGVLVGTAAMTYMGLFYAGILESFSIDKASLWHHPGLLHSSPLINNSLLLLLFCVSHSVLARQSVKSLFLHLLSPSLYRHFFFHQSSLCLFLICYGWTPQPSPTLWDFQSTPLRLTLYGLCTVGVTITFVAFFTLPVLDFIGVSEAVERLTGNKREAGDLVTSGLFSIVRHPMYTSLLICTWCHPTMSMGRLTVAVVLTLYVLVAVPLFEEPDLLEMFGDKYRHYMKTTPMIFPLRLWTSHSNTEKDK